MLAGEGSRSTLGLVFTCINACMFVAVLGALWYCRNEPLMRARGSEWLAVSWIALMPSISLLTGVRDWLGDSESSPAGMLFRCDMIIWLGNISTCAWATSILVSAYRLKVLIDFERAKIVWAQQQQQQTWSHHDDTPQTQDAHSPHHSSVQMINMDSIPVSPTAAQSPSLVIVSEKSQHVNHTMYINPLSPSGSSKYHVTNTEGSPQQYSGKLIHAQAPLMNQHDKSSSTPITPNRELVTHTVQIQSQTWTDSTPSPALAEAHARVSLLAQALSNWALIRYACLAFLPCVVIVAIFNATVYRNYQYQYNCAWDHLEWIPSFCTSSWGGNLGGYLARHLYRVRAHDAFGITMYLIVACTYGIITSAFLMIIILSQPTLVITSWNPLWIGVGLMYIWAIHGCIWPCYISLKQRNARQREHELVQQEHGVVDKPSNTGSKRTSVRIAPYIPDPISRRRSIASHPLYICLHDTAGYDSLLKYAESAFAAENVLFWSAVQAYRQRPSIQHAKQVYDTYIDPASQLEVNLPAHVLDACVQQYQEAQTSESKQVPGMETLFDAAWEEIFEMMRMDIWPRYIESNDGKSYLAQHRIIT